MDLLHLMSRSPLDPAAYALEPREAPAERPRGGSTIFDGGLIEIGADPPSVWWTPMLAFRSWRGVSDECSTPELSGFFQARGR